MEVEWQLDAIDLRPVERWLNPANGSSGAIVAVSDVGGVAVSAHPQPARRMVDTYMDTDDWRVGRSGFVLRVRRRAGVAEVTLKDTAPAVGGLRKRLEVTELLPSDDVTALATTGPVGRRLQALAGTRPLHPIIEVKTKRRPFNLHVGDETVAELALDDTLIEMGAGRAPMHMRRVEIEVVPAWVDALRPVVEQLRRECGLQPATLSKFEAGLLASGLRVPPPPDVGPAVIPPDPTIGDVAYAVMRRNLSAMLAHEPGTRLGEDPEELHDMRVATRRLRAALALFAEVLPARAAHVRGELGWLADLLGTVRDLDVQLERVVEWMNDVSEDDRVALGGLADLLGQERSEARARLLEGLDSTRYETMVTSYVTMLRQGPSRRYPASQAPAITVVPDLVDAKHRSAVKAARRARRSGEAEDFHNLRIRCKRLRYALEFVSEIYEGQPGTFIKTVVRLQDALGLMQDARVAAERLHSLATGEPGGLSPTTIFVMGGVAERHHREAEHMKRKLPKVLKSLGDAQWRKLSELLVRRRAEFYELNGGMPGGQDGPSQVAPRNAVVMPLAPLAVPTSPASPAAPPTSARSPFSLPARPLLRPVAPPQGPPLIIDRTHEPDS